MFLSIARHRSISLKINETKIDKKRSKDQLNIQPLTSKRTLSSSSRTCRPTCGWGGECSPSRLATEAFTTKDQRRRSRSLSELESPTRSFLPPPNIEVGEPETEFSRYHQRFSPNNIKNTNIKDEVFENHATSERKVCIQKSQSDHCMDAASLTSSSSSNTRAKMDAFFKKSKTVLSNVGPKFRDISVKKEGDGDTNKDGEDTNTNEQQQQDQTPSEPMKVTLRKMNQKFLTRAVEVKSKVIPEFRSRIQNALVPSPKPQRKNRLLTEEEKERRMNCKTKIMDL